MEDSRTIAFAQLLRGEIPSLTLDRVALEVARLEYPALPLAAITQPLDQLAQEVRSRMIQGFRLAAERRLFEELGFAGNEEDYYNPRNSCLNWVLESHTGIPITLSIVYIEVARRLGVRVDGIGAPGHFLIRLEDDGDTFYLDPFRGGLIRENVESDIPANFLVSATPRTIAIRMLNNLRQIYLERRAWPKAEAVLNWILTADPRDGAALRQRSATRAALRQFRAAALDLERFLSLHADSPDAEELRRQLTQLHRMHASQN
jgi:regulator of sirC expression with transglutaminase-like and TPR domain